MSQIVKMSEQLANMIAAGEVIERPASVVKELVENAVDAHSSKIEIHLHDAGIRQIRVIDNGDGMSFKDVALAFERHATSKVKSEYDIFRIQTLGFRGEALPSIASVTDVHVRSSNGQDTGVHFHIKGGEILAHEPGVMRKGTDMEVNHLFFNTPARLKHVKSLNTELSHITDYVNKVALAHPEISFKLFNNQRLIFQTNGQNNVQSVISNIYGFDIAKKMIPLEAKNDEIKLKGYVSDPIINRATRHYMILIVNGRAIRHFGLTRAILDAYHTLLPKDKYPIVVLDLKLDPILVDVNVHPAKLEVRFSQEEQLKNFILTEVKKALHQVQYIPETTLATKTINQTPTIVQPRLQQTLTEEVHEKVMPFEQQQPPLTRDILQKLDETLEGETTVVKQLEKNNPQIDVIKKEEEPMSVKVPTPTKTSLELFYIGQLHGTYLLAQNEEGLFLIDQHAAMERIQYEKIYERLKTISQDSMELIVPLLLTYTQKDLLLIQERLSVLTALGFEFEVFGTQELLVRRIPLFAQGDELKSMVEVLIQVLIQDKQLDIGKLREHVAIMMSCKGSIKANQFINEHEIKTLLSDLCECMQPYTCPHGRPIIVKITAYEIQKLFKRVM